MTVLHTKCYQPWNSYYQQITESGHGYGLLEQKLPATINSTPSQFIQQQQTMELPDDNTIPQRNQVSTFITHQYIQENTSFIVFLSLRTTTTTGSTPLLLDTGHDETVGPFHYHHSRITQLQQDILYNKRIQFSLHSSVHGYHPWTHNLQSQHINQYNIF